MRILFLLICFKNIEHIIKNNIAKTLKKVIKKDAIYVYLHKEIRDITTLFINLKFSKNDIY